MLLTGKGLPFNADDEEMAWIHIQNIPRNNMGRKYGLRLSINNLEYDIVGSWVPMPCSLGL
jgi:hypothetical protein